MPTHSSHTTCRLHAPPQETAVAASGPSPKRQLCLLIARPTQPPHKSSLVATTTRLVSNPISAPSYQHRLLSTAYSAPPTRPRQHSPVHRVAALEDDDVGVRGQLLADLQARHGDAAGAAFEHTQLEVWGQGVGSGVENLSEASRERQQRDPAGAAF
eukprot:356378-Chlamydomonas_euryale.AAC.6